MLSAELIGQTSVPYCKTRTLHEIYIVEHCNGATAAAGAAAGAAAAAAVNSRRG